MAEEKAHGVSEFESELAAIKQIVQALEPLKSEARNRVVTYAFQKLGLASEAAPSSEPVRASTLSKHTGVSSGRPPIVDIRTLKEEKQPSSAREMAVLVAYYLSEAAPESERKPEITADEIRQYFKQAGFKLPSAPDMTLVHTRNAGYLDNGSARGQYLRAAFAICGRTCNLPSLPRPCYSAFSSAPPRGAVCIYGRLSTWGTPLMACVHITKQSTYTAHI